MLIINETIVSWFYQIRMLVMYITLVNVPEISMKSFKVPKESYKAVD
jgi:hypothetical protein